MEKFCYLKFCVFVKHKSMLEYLIWRTFCYSCTSKYSLLVQSKRPSSSLMKFSVEIVYDFFAKFSHWKIRLWYCSKSWASGELVVKVSGQSQGREDLDRRRCLFSLAKDAETAFSKQKKFASRPQKSHIGETDHYTV